MSLSRETFHQRTFTACRQAVLGCRRYAVQPVPDATVLRVFPNASCDDVLRPGEIVFPEETPPSGSFLGPMSPTDFAEWAWRDGRVPEWIDINAYEVTKTTTVLEVLVCGRFTDRHDLLYHQAAGIPPFHVLSPALPPGYVPAKDGEEPTRFDVNWLARRHGLRPAAEP